MTKPAAISVALFSILIAFVFVRSLESHFKSNSSRVREANQAPSTFQATRIQENSQVLTPENNTKILNAKAMLHENELQRIRFCRERECKNKIVYEFVIEAPTKEDRDKITEICLSVKGLTKNWFSENVTSWQQELLDQYLLSSEYKFFSVFIEWPTNGNNGTYSILGIEDGMLSYDENGSPTSSDGYANVVKIGAPFKIDSKWRFSHILEFDQSN